MQLQPKTFLLLFVILTQLACSERKVKTDFDYIKIFASSPADTVNKYNKGLGLYRYAYYEPQSDSLIYQYDDGTTDLSNFKTYAGRAGSNIFFKSVENTLTLLRKHKNGIINPDTDRADLQTELYVEFKDSQGLHYYIFLNSESDTLEKLNVFLHQLDRMTWKTNLVNNSIINRDKEVVDAATKLGVYQTRKTPYIPLLCEKKV